MPINDYNDYNDYFYGIELKPDLFQTFVKQGILVCEYDENFPNEKGEFRHLKWTLSENEKYLTLVKHPDRNYLFLGIYVLSQDDRRAFDDYIVRYIPLGVEVKLYYVYMPNKW